MKSFRSIVCDPNMVAILWGVRDPSEMARWDVFFELNSIFNGLLSVAIKTKEQIQSRQNLFQTEFFDHGLVLGLISSGANSDAQIEQMSALLPASKSLSPQVLVVSDSDASIKRLTKEASKIWKTKNFQFIEYQTKASQHASSISQS